MKKIKNILKGGAAAILSAAMAISVAACTTPTDDSGKDPDTPIVTPTPTITVEISGLGNGQLKKGEKLQLTATVTGSDNTAVNWSVSDPTLAKISASGELEIIGDVQYNKTVQVTATSQADPSVSVTRTITVIAPTAEGQVGLLTGDMIEALGADNLTVTGVLTDYYVDYNASFNSTTHKYNMEVKMDDGAWYGRWQNDPNDPMSGDAVWTESLYLRGEAVTDGHELKTTYIDKNNQVSDKVITDYMSLPVLWESQHLYNHIGQLNVNEFTQVSADDATQYVYYVDDTDEASLYLMTYLSYSLTPLLSDTLDRIIFVLNEEGTAIEKLVGQTETLLYGENTEDDPDAMSYTTIELTFSDIGETEVPMPTPYEAPEHADLLSAALEKMQTSRNYQFTTADTTTYAPSGGEGDYTIESAGGAVASSLAATLATENEPAEYPAIKDYTSETGTAGLRGWVTEEGILFAETTQYTASMDGKNYRVEFTGYKPNDGYYEEFAFDSDLQVFYGTRRVNGDMFDAMPGFDFSANVFEFIGAGQNNTYVFQLRSDAITRDIAMEVSAHSNAKSASSSSSYPLQITVDANGNLVSTRFPYSLVSGTYIGYCTTTYSGFGTTEIVENDAFRVFDGYIERGTMDSWDQYSVRYYYPNHSTIGGATAIDAATLFTTIYDGAVPAPTVFMNVFGDAISGPFFNWYDNEDEEGNVEYADYVTLTVFVAEDALDENSHLLDASSWVTKIENSMTAAGYQRSAANTDLDNVGVGTNSWDLSYTNGTLIVHFESNNTRTFWIEIYNVGDWTLNG